MVRDHLWNKQKEKTINLIQKQQHQRKIKEGMQLNVIKNRRKEIDDFEKHR